MLLYLLLTMAWFNQCGMSCVKSVQYNFFCLYFYVLQYYHKFLLYFGELQIWTLSSHKTIHKFNDQKDTK